jgi:hypothetical protein
MDRRAFIRLGGLGALGMAARPAADWAPPKADTTLTIAPVTVEFTPKLSTS